MLWGNDQPARPNEQIAVLVSRLRAVLGSHRVLLTDAGWGLCCDWLDVEEVTARVEEAERRVWAGQPSAARAAAEAAVALVTGTFQPGEDGAQGGARAGGKRARGGPRPSRPRRGGPGRR